MHALHKLYFYALEIFIEYLFCFWRVSDTDAASIIIWTEFQSHKWNFSFLQE